MKTVDAPPEPAVLERLRRLLLALVVFGATGLLLELALMEHWDAWTQWIPLVILGTAVGGALGVLRSPAPPRVRAFRWIMGAAFVAGVVGVALHYGSNAELEREIAPDRPAFEIFRASLGGGTPLLSPGAMIQLGLLGLVAVHRLPGSPSSPSRSSPS